MNPAQGISVVARRLLDILPGVDLTGSEFTDVLAVEVNDGQEQREAREDGSIDAKAAEEAQLLHPRRDPEGCGKADH